MKLYNERTTKDFLWITVLYSCKVNGWPRSLNLSTTRSLHRRQSSLFASYINISVVIIN